MKPSPLLLMMLIPSFLFAKPLEVGQPAPELTVTTDESKELVLADVYAKGPVLIYFYPKSDTAGCTRQACNIRDNFGKLRAAGVKVLGVSMDSVENQAAFREKYSLPFNLIADSDSKLGKAFGVATYAGAAYRRQSFMIVDGTVVWRDLSAQPDNQSEDALGALAALKD